MRVVSHDECRITRQMTWGGTPVFRSRSPQDRRRSWAVAYLVGRQVRSSAGSTSTSAAFPIRQWQGCRSVSPRWVAWRHTYCRRLRPGQGPGQPPVEGGEGGRQPDRPAGAGHEGAEPGGRDSGSHPRTAEWHEPRVTVGERLHLGILCEDYEQTAAVGHPRRPAEEGERTDDRSRLEVGNRNRGNCVPRRVWSRV